MITLLVNPVAGGGKAKNVAFSVAKRLTELNLPYRIWETHYPGEAKELAQNIIEYLKPIREKRAYLEQHKKDVCKILFDGSDKARKAAAQTLNNIKKAMGIDYRNLF